MILLCFVASERLHAIDLSNINIAWQYDEESELKIDHRVVENELGTIVYLEAVSDSLSKWDFTYYLQEDYKDREERGIEPSLNYLFKDSTKVLLELIPQIEQEENLLVVLLTKDDLVLYYDINLKNKSLNFPSITPVDENGLPILKPYLSGSDFSWTGSDYYFTMRYNSSIELPDPPMADVRILAPKEKLDSMFTFTDSVSFENGYFYSVLADSNAATSLTILKVPPYYPEYRKLDELIESMLLIANEPERNSLISSKNPKLTFDSFWLNTYYTKRRARGAIRSYYNRIRKANYYFTDYKHGWKTDRGFIYVIFGTPVEVYRSDNDEVWYYRNNESFEFNVLSTFFTARDYRLKRDIKYEDSWYDQLATLRSGIYE